MPRADRMSGGPYVKLAAMTAPAGLSEDDRRYRKSRIVWAAMLASVVLYVPVAILVRPAATAENTNVERVLMALAVAYVAASIPAKRWLLVQANAVDSQRLRDLALVVPLLLCEIAAITGLALRFAVGSTHYYVFLAVALIGMLLHFPRRAN